MSHRGSQLSLPSFSELIQGIPPAPLLDSTRMEGKGTPSAVVNQVRRPLDLNPDTMVSPTLLLESDDNNSGEGDSNSVSQDEPRSPSQRTPTPPPTYHQPSNHDFALERLQDLISQPKVDANVLTQHISTLLDVPVQHPYEQGWYRPHASDNIFSKRLEEAIFGLSRDELAEAYFFRQEDREPYGYFSHGISCSRKSSEKKQVGWESPGLSPPDTEPMVKREKQQKNSSEQERRCRHRYCQMQSDLRCSEIAFQCGEQHAKIEHDRIAKTRENGSKCQSAKGTGKDEQLFAAVYAHELSARIVQLEHDGRKRAETIVQMLCQSLLQSQGVKSSIAENRPLSESPPLLSRNGSIIAGVKRSADHENTNRRCWTTDTGSNLAKLSNREHASGTSGVA
ncbi:hypothetical protein LTR10_011612 [Elasticomyces elasticus]|uniref:Uncharacterized protein n=1 Tax=Exophiala sideris TaxID=1016849 RepID=A0ABR0JDK3_9EURO|nr:hypothetical protein LTR10_011612 [Elasticomyces elasticus]KAK5061807.1 hypothetical protein LTR69_004990 [Exophiala sideris]KAK5184507.1 hypothetical protein LTR44_003181 [Eurotiomycetes sp. CCFEE 6388]